MKYFIEINKNQKGPLTFEEIKAYKLERTSLVWKEGTTDWKPAEEFEEFKSFFIASPPPLPHIETPSSAKFDYKRKAKTEIGANLILLAISIGISIIFLAIYSDINKPEYLTADQLKSNSQDILRQLHSGGSINFWGNYVPKNCKYCNNIHPNDIAYGNINDIVKIRYNGDVQRKTISSFFISLVILIVGRYGVIGIKQLYKDQ